MNFNTALFLFLFLPFFLIVYVFAQPRWRPVIGISASIVFYAWGDLSNLILLCALILINYWVALFVSSSPLKKWLLSFGLFVNLGTLVFFKLFITHGMNLFLGSEVHFPQLLTDGLNSITFPLGLSYICFQLISYLFDVQKGTITSEKNFVAFAFYVLLFPKILVGPIVRFSSVVGQLSAPVLNSHEMAVGVRRFLAGFAKKILIADVLANVVDAVFSLPVEALTPLFGWLGLVAYALQIYFDFSGYTDMAVGLASMMGLRFIENFNYPYVAQSITDFWRRWHISLSTWFRDYVFYPLERRRIPVIGQSFNILVVFLLTGLWHGVAVNLIVWGLLHGFFIVLEGLFLNRWLQKMIQPIRHFYALVALLLTWLVFRAPSLEYVFQFLNLLIGNAQGQIHLAFADTSPLPFIDPSFVLAMVAGIFLSLPLGPVIQKRLDKSVPLTVAGDILLFGLFILGIGFMTSSKFLPGIYGSF